MNPDVCLHENIDKEVLMGIRTGDRICLDCKAVFTSSEELKKARDAARNRIQDKK
jgi:hypothetical protein